MINPAPLRFMLDILAASVRTADLAASAATLAGIPGDVAHPGLLHALSGGDGSTGNTEYGAGDDGFIVSLDPAFSRLVTNLTPDVVTAGNYNSVIRDLNSYLQGIGSLSFTDLNTYATYQNGLVRDSFLVHPSIAYLWWLWTSKKANLRMLPGNVFAPLTTFGAATVAAGAVVTYTAGAAPNAILTANDLTGNLQGYTPAPGLSATITAAVSGTLTITVTATGRTSSGALVSGRTWTAVLSSAASGTTIVFTPTVAGDRIASITSVSGAGAASSGAFTLQSVIERIVT